MKQAYCYAARFARSNYNAKFLEHGKSIKSGGFFKPGKIGTEFSLYQSWNVGGLELERSSVSNL